MELVLTKTMTEKLQEIFFKKCSSFYEIEKRNGWQIWCDYLNSLDGVEYIYEFSHLAPVVDYLIESLNENPAKRIVIRDTGSREFFKNRDAFILLDLEVAEKILVLGILP